MRFRKTGSRAAISSEAASLRWLAEAETDGGAAVAELLGTGEGWLETRLLERTSPDPEAAREFGRRLARTHAAGARFWGQTPPGLDPADARLAELPAPAVAAPRWDSWGAFYAEARLQPYLDLGLEAGHLGSGDAALCQRAVDVVAGGAHDSPQPAAVADGVARLHGDLWSGNVVWAAGAQEAVGTLIDPSAHGGHAETDLAELALFGAPHVGEIVAGYQEVSALAHGWAERVPLHQFHMLLVHVALFGGSYVGQSVAVARQLV